MDPVCNRRDQPGHAGGARREKKGGGRQPALISCHGFHTGAPDSIDNEGDGDIDETGDLWTGREEEPLKGVELWREEIALPDDPGRDGQFAHEAVVIERIEAEWSVRDLAGC